MKIIKLFLVISAVITIGYFSWSYYSDRLLREKHERAILVFEMRSNTAKAFYPERLLCI